MSKPEFFATPGYGDTQLINMHYQQAVRIGDRVETSGQGGWDDDFDFPADLEEEIVRAFDNLERTLAEASVSWADVIAVDSYHVPSSPVFIGEDHGRIMVEQLRKRFGDRSPIWTQLGVAALGAPKMRVEIRATAVTGLER